MIELRIKQPIHTAHGTLDLEIHKEIKENEFLCLFGESGAGKTTILRIIAGLLKPKFGFIKVQNEVWLDTEKNIFLPPQKRRVGFVFQDYALFPNLNVAENIAYGLDKKDEKAVNELLELMNLKELAKSYPTQLSGGQAQRVALARAIVRKPKILLLDEPLSALDLKMRSFLQDELLKLSRHFKLTTLLVSHDIAEIYKLATRVLELESGKIIKDCTPQELFSHKNMSAKLQLQALILDIKEADLMMILTLLVGQELVKITLSKKEFNEKKLALNQNIIISQKAFNIFIVGE